jgi:hypothetical protein
MRALQRAWLLGVGALIGGSFYLLLIDTTSLPELLVLTGVALACGVGFELSREQGFVEASLRRAWLAQTWRVLVKIGSDIPIVCWEALVQLVAPRPARGSFRAVSFEAVEETAPDTGRRALTEWIGSIAPNTIVVGVDAERKLLLVHQLRRGGEPDEVDPLRLG